MKVLPVLWTDKECPQIADFAALVQRMIGVPVLLFPDRHDHEAARRQFMCVPMVGTDLGPFSPVAVAKAMQIASVLNCDWLFLLRPQGVFMDWTYRATLEEMAGLLTQTDSLSNVWAYLTRDADGLPREDMWATSVKFAAHTFPLSQHLASVPFGQAWLNNMQQTKLTGVAQYVEPNAVPA